MSKYFKTSAFKKNSRSNLLILSVFLGIPLYPSCNNDTSNVSKIKTEQQESIHIPPDTSTIPDDEFGDMVRYGRNLILNTAYYIGPEGTVRQNLGNKMNCTNCHLDAGTRPYGLNFFSTHARYPQYRARENRILTLAERVNNCIERPHNGVAIPLDSKEMIAIVSYMKWLSGNVPTGQRVAGDEGIELVYPDRAADPKRGETLYITHCASCHGKEGQGVFNLDSTTYVYPPLWGPNSYERGSSMHRVLKAARFIKANMPHKQAFWNKPVLTDEEAIDVAAFINDDRIHSRPVKEGRENYPNFAKKPIDYDEGPYADSFSAFQHKFGPYKPIIDDHKRKGIPVIF